MLRRKVPRESDFFEEATNEVVCDGGVSGEFGAQR